MNFVIQLSSFITEQVRSAVRSSVYKDGSAPKYCQKLYLAQKLKVVTTISRNLHSEVEKSASCCCMQFSKTLLPSSEHQRNIIKPSETPSCINQKSLSCLQIIQNASLLSWLLLTGSLAVLELIFRFYQSLLQKAVRDNASGFDFMNCNYHLQKLLKNVLVFFG